MSEISMEQHIIETAERLFLKRGFALTSTTDIAREAGCNQSLINYYFRSKEKLFQSIFEKKARLFLSTLSSPLNMKIPYLEKIRILCESHFELLSRNIELPYFVLNEVRSNPERLEVFRTIVNRSLSRISPSLEQELSSEIEAERIRPTTLFDILLTMASLNIGSIMLFPVLREIYPPGNLDIETLLREKGKENGRILLLSLVP